MLAPASEDTSTAVCCELGHRLLHDDEAPELASVELVHVTAAHLVQRFAADGRSALEGILAEVHDRGHVRRDLLAGPAVWLLVELEFEIINPDRAEVRATKIEDFMPGGWSGAGQQTPSD